MAFEQRTGKPTVVGVEGRRARDGLLECGGTLLRYEGVDLDVVCAGQEREPGNADLEPSGRAGGAVSQRPLLLGREQWHAVLARTWLVVVAQHDLGHALCPQPLGPGLSENCQAGLADRGGGELPVMKRRSAARALNSASAMITVGVPDGTLSQAKGKVAPRSV